MKHDLKRAVLSVSSPNSFSFAKWVWLVGWLLGCVWENGCFGPLVLKKPGYDYGCFFQQNLLFPRSLLGIVTSRKTSHVFFCDRLHVQRRGGMMASVLVELAEPFPTVLRRRWVETGQRGLPLFCG